MVGEAGKVRPYLDGIEACTAQGPCCAHPTALRRVADPCLVAGPDASPDFTPASIGQAPRVEHL